MDDDLQGICMDMPQIQAEASQFNLDAVFDLAHGATGLEVMETARETGMMSVPVVALG